MTIEAPIRCLTCGYIIGDKMHKFIPFVEEVKAKRISDAEKEALISKEILSYENLIPCCRTYFIAFVPWVRIIK